MVIKSQIYTFIWNDDFILVDNEEKPSSEDIILYIDDESQYMRLTYPSSTSLILRTKLQSKLAFIQKRGLWIERLNQRVGKGYEFHVDLESSSSTLHDQTSAGSTPSSDDNDQENNMISSIESGIRIVKQIWMHKRTHEGTDLMNQEKYGQPEKYVQFRASDFEQLDIKIRSLPDSIVSNKNP